jgi:hypothetical protein
MGAARLEEPSGALTMTAADGIELARFPFGNHRFGPLPWLGSLH